MKTFYFVRHGESKSNVSGIYTGSDALLTETGKKQSEFLANRFKTIPIDIIIASTYPRTRDTAEIFNRQLQKPVEYSDLIVEIRYPSEMRGLSKTDPKRSAIEQAMKAHRSDRGWKYSDEESFTELQSRGRQALEFLQTVPHKQVTVVTHGGILRMMISIMLHGDVLTPKEFWNTLTFLKTSNTGITICKYDPSGEVRNGWRMLTWNDHAHLGEVN